MAEVDRYAALRERVDVFVRERDWDQFHNPKNLAMALATEVGELVEHFQWLSAEQSARLDDAAKAEVAHEIADVFIFLLRLADKLGIDPIAAAEHKLVLNAAKYPIELARGRATKYNKL